MPNFYLNNSGCNMGIIGISKDLQKKFVKYLWNHTFEFLLSPSASEPGVIGSHNGFLS